MTVRDSGQITYQLTREFKKNLSYEKFNKKKWYLLISVSIKKPDQFYFSIFLFFVNILIFVKKVYFYTQKKDIKISLLVNKKLLIFWFDFNQISIY